MDEECCEEVDAFTNGSSLCIVDSVCHCDTLTIDDDDDDDGALEDVV